MTSLFVALFSGVWFPTIFQPSSITELVATSGYYDAHWNEIEDPTLPALIEFAFLLIPGELVGEASFPALLQGTLPVGADMRLDLRSLMPVAERFAGAARESFLQNGSKVQPAEAKFARLATFAFDREKDTVRGFRMGFRELARDRGVVVMYFDRSCEITGTHRLPDGEYEYQVRVLGPGFYWLLMEPRSRGGFVIHNREKPESVVAYFIAEKPN